MRDPAKSIDAYEYDEAVDEEFSISYLRSIRPAEATCSSSHPHSGWYFKLHFQGEQLPFGRKRPRRFRGRFANVTRNAVAAH